MKEYHKIQSLFLRNEVTNFKTFLEGQWTTPEFEYLRYNAWVFEEKVDGTNIRVIFDGEKVQFGGRTDNAQIPSFLVTKLMELFPAEKLKEVFPEGATLYGEGYGAKIQSGDTYIKDGCNFILFDVTCGGAWLTRESCRDIAQNLSISMVPIIAAGTLNLAIDMCRNGFASALRETPPEGLILRPIVDLFDRRGQRVISKLKLKDFPAEVSA